MQSTVEIQPDSVTNPPISVVIQPTVVVRPTAVAHEESNHSVQSTGVPVEHDGNKSLLHNDIMELQLYQNALGVFVCKENSLNFLYCPGKEYNQYIRQRILVVVLIWRHIYITHGNQNRYSVNSV